MPPRVRTSLLIAMLLALVTALPLHAAPLLRIGIITDIHYADRPTASGRYYPSAVGKTDAFITAMNAATPDFIIELGDFKDMAPPPTTPPVKANTLQYLDTIESHFAAFQGPRYHVLGNHDLDSISKPEFLAHITNTALPAANYYSFDRAGVHCVVLDGCYKADGTDYDSGNYNWIDANIPPIQQKWLAADLAAHRRPTLVFVHQRLDLDDNADANIKQGAAIRKLLEDSRQILAVFSGHDHAGGYTLINGIHYLTMVGSIEGSADTTAGNAFALATLSADTPNTYRLDIQGFHRQPTRTNLTATLSLPATPPATISDFSSDAEFKVYVLTLPTWLIITSLAVGALLALLLLALLRRRSRSKPANPPTAL